jgi:anaerobic ribonucleoside-triphosphate reductase activating protein
MQYVDVVVDGKYDKNLRDVTLLWKGSSNQRVIDVQESLTTGKVKIHCPDHYSVLDPNSVYGSSKSGVPCMY